MMMTQTEDDEIGTQVEIVMNTTHTDVLQTIEGQDIQEIITREIKTEIVIKEVIREDQAIEILKADEAETRMIAMVVRKALRVQKVGGILYSTSFCFFYILSLCLYVLLFMIYLFI